MPLSSTLATALSVLHTSLYVGVLYTHPLARPRRPGTTTTLPTSRDDPILIRTRIRLITVATLLSTTLTATTIYGLSGDARGWHDVLEKMGLVLKLDGRSVRDIARTTGLVGVLFAGSLWERVVVGQGWKRVDEGVKEIGRSWGAWRNYVAGPLTEEIVFRACMVPPLALAGWSAKKLVFASPLFFGIAHLHHLYEFLLQHPGRLGHGLIRTAVQFSYTTVFGWLATFIYVRTGSVWAAVSVHAFCNYMGLPNFGRVHDEYDEKWGTWVDYVHWGLHVGGLWGFSKLLWSWTDSPNALVRF